MMLNATMQLVYSVKVTTT